MKKRVLAVLLAFSMTAALTAGCGSSSDPKPAAPESEAEGSAESAEAAEAEKEPSAEDKSAGEDKSAAGETAAAGTKTEAAAGDTEAIPDSGDNAAPAGNGGTQKTKEEAPEIPGLTCESVMPLTEAECFNVFYYNDGFKVIDVPLSGQYLIVPEGADAPADVPADMTVINQPLQNIYLAATGVMSFFDELGAINAVTMTSLDESGWTIEAPIKALKEGSMVFAGKYSMPDYEMLINHGCDLALQSTMILHTPEVQEMEEDLGIPVFIDRSSYELGVLGRIEWIKLYGAMMNLEDVAKEKFEQQKAVVNSLENFGNTGKTVAFFSINSNREVVVRRTQDFIPNMIEKAGGKYVFDNLTNPGSNSASVQLNMEAFYNTAINADFLIYNGTIMEPLKSIDDLIAKDPLFAEFKAVKEGNVWQVDSRWYQSTATVGYLITDLNAMLTGHDDTGLVFMTKLK